MKTCVTLLVALGCLRAAGPEIILLRGATVHLVTGPDIADGSVLMRDGKIAEVGAHIASAQGRAGDRLEGPAHLSGHDRLGH